MKLIRASQNAARWTPKVKIANALATWNAYSTESRKKVTLVDADHEVVPVEIL